MPHRPRSHSWQEIRDFYEDFVKEPDWHIGPMIDLVQFISESPYASGLFPYTSHTDLHIGRVSNFACGDNELTVVYNIKTKTFTFTYQQREDDTKPWSIECDAANGKDKLTHLLHKRLRWFHEG